MYAVDHRTLSKTPGKLKHVLRDEAIAGHREQKIEHHQQYVPELNVKAV